MLPALARYRLPAVVPGVPIVRLAPWTASVPVKLAVEDIVWPLIVPPIVALLVTLSAVPAALKVLAAVKVLAWFR